MEQRWEQEGVNTRALPLKLQSGGPLEAKKLSNLPHVQP